MRAAIRGGGARAWLLSALSERIMSMSGSSGMSSFGCSWEPTMLSSESERELSMALRVRRSLAVGEVISSRASVSRASGSKVYKT